MIKYLWCNKAVISLFMVVFFVGCASKDLKKFNESYYDGDVHSAYSLAKEMSNLNQQNQEEEGQENKKGNDDLMWQVQAGIAGFYANAEDTKDFLLAADSNMQESIKTFASKFFGDVGAILTSDNALPYPIYLYEASMVNYYLALDSLSRKEDDVARIYLNQAIERQNDAKAYYAKELEATNKDLNSMNKFDENAPKDEQYLAVTMGFAKSKSKDIPQVQEKYINPMIPYMKFLFEMRKNNFSSIASMGADTLALIPEEDRAILQSRKQGDKKRYIWVIVEDGRSAFKDTLAFSIPLPIDPSAFLNPVSMVAAMQAMQGDMKGADSTMVIASALSGAIMLNYAEPKLIDGEDFAQSYKIGDVEAKKFFSMEELIKTEFYKRMPGVRTRAILRSIPPAVGAWVANEAGKQAGFNGLGFLVSLGHRAVISADTRIISALPNSFYVMRIENTEGEKKLLVDDNNSIQFNIKNQSEDAIVYVRNLGHKLFVRILD